MKRREFLTAVGAGLAGAAAASCTSSLPATGSGETAAPFVPDVELSLTAAPRTIPIRSGEPTRVWSYTGQVLNGPADVLQHDPDSYLGPTIRVRTGQRVRVHFKNELPEPTIIHWHGLDVPAAMDGHPRSAIPSGGQFVYEFEVNNRAGTYWYHPHHHNRTGPQVYYGLAGLFLVSDAEEEGLGLPAGAEDLHLVLQDRAFDAGNQFVYVSGMPMDVMTGFLGDVVLVNGRPQPSFSLATRAYRVRILNGSNSRVYKIALGDGTPVSIIGTDGGLLERPVERPFAVLAPGERVEAILDLSRHKAGSVVELKSLAYPAAPFEMAMGMGMGRGRGGMGSGGHLPAGAPLSLCTLRVDREGTSSFKMPARLSTYDSAWEPVSPSLSPRRIAVGFARMQWLLNGRVFEMESVDRSETVTAGAQEIWEFDNTGPGMMGMQLAHPLHLHGRQFRVLGREQNAAADEAWNALREGIADEGWKDTFLVMPGERVRILVKFSDYPGLYLYHCHNLEHEDMGMMRNYRIVEQG